jgi:spermidine synthase
MRSNWFLYLVIFVSGMTTLAIEMTASRLLGSIYGTSNLIWANVIGLILLYLTAGYFLGGWWADRSPHRQTLYRILIWGAFLSALVPLISRPILAEAARAFAGLEAGLILGSFVSVLILFAAPITLFGTASPFAVRLAVYDVQSAGKISGRIYAVSTLGSLIGTFLPVLIIIPELGTFGTFILFSGLLYLICMIGLWREQPRSALRLAWMPAVITGLALVVMSQPMRAAAEGAAILYETESGYNYIQVQEDSAGNRYLYLNEGQGVHSRYHPTIYGYGQTWDFFLAAPYFNAPPFAPEQVKSLAVIGLAAGTIPRQYTHVYGAIPIDGIEIDSKIIDVGRAFFDMTMPNLTAYADDGRYRLNRLDRRYTVIGIDAYRPPYIPWHLTTVEFFQEARSKLDDHGVVAINVGRTDTDRRLVEALTATLLEVYPTVHTIDVPLSFNTILIATRQPTIASNLADNLAALPADASPLLRDTLALAVRSLVPTRRGDLVFTDNRAPVETLVDSLVINFLLSGGTDQLRRN